MIRNNGFAPQVLQNNSNRSNNEKHQENVHIKLLEYQLEINYLHVTDIHVATPFTHDIPFV